MGIRIVIIILNQPSSFLYCPGHLSGRPKSIIKITTLKNHAIMDSTKEPVADHNDSRKYGAWMPTNVITILIRLVSRLLAMKMVPKSTSHKMSKILSKPMQEFYPRNTGLLFSLLWEYCCCLSLSLWRKLL